MKKYPRDISFQDDLDERLKDPEFRAAYEECDSEVRLAVAIAQAREKAGLTQAELAKRLHTKQSNISRIEKGGQNFTLATLKKIAKELNLRWDFQLRPV